jgi:hypothetical protein
MKCRRKRQLFQSTAVSHLSKTTELGDVYMFSLISFYTTAILDRNNSCLSLSLLYTLISSLIYEYCCIVTDYYLLIKLNCRKLNREKCRKSNLSLLKKAVLASLWSLGISHEKKYEYMMNNKQDVVDCIRNVCAANRIPSVSFEDLIMFIKKREELFVKKNGKTPKGKEEKKIGKESTDEVNYFNIFIVSYLIIIYI